MYFGMPQSPMSFDLRDNICGLDQWSQTQYDVDRENSNLAVCQQEGLILKMGYLKCEK
jgi:hypothetical protein